MIRMWLTAGVLALLAGCQSDGPILPPPPSVASVRKNTPDTPPVAEVSRPQPATSPDTALPGGLLPVSYRVRPAVSAVAEDNPEPVVVAPAHRGTSATAPARPAQSPRLRILPVPGAFSRPIVATPIPESPYACSVDYQWLLGRLHYDAERKRWSICYSDGGVPDRHGGVLELVGTGPMNGFQAGQFVRVEGELIDPAPMEIKPAYRVRALQGVIR